MRPKAVQQATPRQNAPSHPRTLADRLASALALLLKDPNACILSDPHDRTATLLRELGYGGALEE